ncbi:MAG: ABC transporter permease, partial [Bacilli bacterium]
MYILKNAIQNLIRNKGRNALMAIILVAVLACTSIALIIDSTSNEMIAEYKKSFGAEVFIQPDMNKMATASSYKEITNEIKEKLAESKYVKESVFSALFNAYSETIRSIDQKPDAETNRPGMGVIADGVELSDNFKVPNLMISGGLSISEKEEFRNKTREIVKGKMPEKNNDVIISQDFAKLNNLDVGSSFEVKNPNDPSKYPTIKFNVVGIYFDGTEAQDLGFKHPMLNRKNQIITTYETLIKYNELLKTDYDVQKDAVGIDAKYYLKNPEMVDALNKEAHALGLDDVYDVTTDATTYNNLIKPLEGLKSVSKTFMFLVLGFGGG